MFHYKMIREVWARRKTVDFVLFHPMSAPWMFFLWLVMLFLPNRPLFVMDTRTLPMESKKERTRKATIRAYYFSFIAWFSRWWVDGQLTITQRMAEALNIPHKQLWGIWTSGVRLEPFVEASANRQWAGKDEPIDLNYIGSLAKERYIDVLARAVIRAHQAGYPVHFTIIGAGNARNELQTLAQNSGGAVIVLDPVAFDQVPILLAKSHIGVLPFPDEEQFRVSSPIKLFEYMASGMPILATRIVCHTDVLGDAPFVFWAESATEDAFYEAIKRLVDARDQLPTLGNASAIEGKKWSWQSVAQHLYDGLMRGRQKRLSRQNTGDYPSRKVDGSVE